MSSILDVSSYRSAPPNWTRTKSFVVHLAEGIQEKSRKEFDTLKAKQLLRAETAIIHGTAFGDAEFTEMGTVGAKLIWSPQSNLASTERRLISRSQCRRGWRCRSAWNGIRVAATRHSINSEWRSRWMTSSGGVIGGADWVRMITTNPARALAVDHLIGTLPPARPTSPS
jgi:hypothetical protein